MDQPDDVLPGDPAQPGDPQSAEAPCRACAGTGRVEGGACRACGGSGKVIETVGDA
jgi:DnaJ-class molecular chaperone